ncbi:MAG: tRNA (adenosine(37)-N6)-threonylcarbamoyltransferase complex ATPase subunit type 1 TsaE [Candidatus Margulisbacteria bacterium]|nr:tRNA (adenosine(37)-N6)-threonylcarbamoyltransferase complex ATPase subunit type 1 TsaE [Candidatus Margulisiibacteriota bacterium]
MSEKYLVKSLKDTQTIARTFASRLKPGDVIALEGELGAGKTTFVRAAAEFFKVKEYVNSPTFTIVNQYKGKKTTINHIDYYRINHQDELAEIGIEEYFSPQSITFIEWAERFPDSLPEKCYNIHIKVKDKTREILISHA